MYNRIDTYIFEKEFKDEVKDAKAQAKSTTEAYQEMYGGEEKFLAALQQYGYRDISQFESEQYISNLQNIAIKEYAKTLVKDKEIKEAMQISFSASLSFLL